MKTIGIICFVLLIIASCFYDKWSYKVFCNKSVVNSKHPDWKPFCGVNFIEKDPDWFKQNGYDKYVK